VYESLAAFPYHAKNVSKAHGMFCAAYLWINAVFFFLYIITESTIASNILYIVGVGLACFVKLYLNLRNYYAKVKIKYKNNPKYHEMSVRRQAYSIHFLL